MQAESWIVPEPQRVLTRKGYLPPDSRILPVDTVVIHYTAGADSPLLPRVKAWAEKPAHVNEASTHFVTSRRPSAEPTLQLAPLTARTWHSGGSVFKGAGSVNARSVGVDFDNVGFLQRKNGAVVDSYGRPYKGPAPFVDAAGRLWEPYTEAAVLEVCRLILILIDVFPALAYRPDRITGHENIKATKSDPGRAFDQFWPALRETMNGNFPTGLTAV
jgi:N-acetyl-anhydromuramyl-L-alanine amidase AmpD